MYFGGLVLVVGFFLLLLNHKAVKEVTNLHCFLSFTFGFMKDTVVLLASPIQSHFYFLQNPMICTGKNLLYKDVEKTNSL